MKKYLCFIIIFFIIVFSPIISNRTYVFADSISSEINQELEENINNQINSLDMGELNDILKQITNSPEIFGGNSFSQKVKDIISGKLSIDASTFIEYLVGLFLDDVVLFLPYICMIISIAIIYSMVSVSHSGKNKTLNDVIHFVCFSAVVVMVIVWVSTLLLLTTNTLSGVKRQMDIIFPLLLTVMTALGGSVSVGVYQPAMAILSGTVISFFISILMPIFTFGIIFTIVSNLARNVKFNKFADFFNSSFKWLMGIVLMLFSSFISIQGLMAGSVDSISLKTAKYTIKSAVPIIGGFLSDGISLIMVSGVLIKNAVGVGGLLLLFCTMLLPIIKIIVFSFLMKLASAILEPIADNRITSFVSSVAKSLQLLIALLIGVGFMYFLIISLVMCSTNIF